MFNLEDNEKYELDKEIYLFAFFSLCIISYFNFYVAMIFFVHQALWCFYSLFFQNEKHTWIVLLLAIIITLFHLGYQKSHAHINSGLQSNEQLTNELEYNNYGIEAYNNGKYLDAIKDFSEAIKLKPDYSEAFLNRGASKANLKQFESALTDYTKAEFFGNHQSVLYSNFGVAYYNLKQPIKAKINLEKALSIDSTNANAYRYRGHIKYDENNNNGAIEDYTFAIKYNPSAANYFSRGLGYYYIKDYKTAIRDINKAIDINPDAAQYYYDRGDAKEELSDFNGACNDYEIAKQKGYSVPQFKIDKCTPKVVYVQNGIISGCNDYKQKYKYNIDNKLIITVGNNSNVAVKIIDFYTKSCIRYVYINKGTKYTITNIPEGIYNLKIAYGEDWSVMQGQPICSGKFSRNTLFEKGEDILDYNLVKTSDGTQVPSYSLKLDVRVSDGINEKNNSFTTNKINESDFYNE